MKRVDVNTGAFRITEFYPFLDDDAPDDKTFLSPKVFIEQILFDEGVEIPRWLAPSIRIEIANTGKGMDIEAAAKLETAIFELRKIWYEWDTRTGKTAKEVRERKAQPHEER